MQASVAPPRPFRFPPAKGFFDDPDQPESRAGAYRARLADRRVLVVLDDAGDLDQVGPLIPGTPGCAVIVTSRTEQPELVAFHGAHPLTLDVLTDEDAVVLLAHIIGTARAGAEAAAAAELARLCGNRPRMLRVAGAHLAGRPFQGIRGYLDDLAAGRPVPAAGAHRAGRRMRPVRPAAHTGRLTGDQPSTGAGPGAN